MPAAQAPAPPTATTNTWRKGPAGHDSCRAQTARRRATTAATQLRSTRRRVNPPAGQPAGGSTLRRVDPPAGQRAGGPTRRRVDPPAGQRRPRGLRARARGEGFRRGSRKAGGTGELRSGGEKGSWRAPATAAPKKRGADRLSPGRASTRSLLERRRVNAPRPGIEPGSSA